MTQNEQKRHSKPTSIASLLLIALLGPLASVSAYAINLVDLGANVDPRDINNFGTVVGARNTDQYPTVAFRWTSASGYENLDGTIANAVNDREEITGNTLTGAFFYDGTALHYIGDYYTGSGVNALGKVAGSKSKDNPYRAAPRPVDPAIYDPNANGQKWDVLDVANVYPRGTRQGVYADLYALLSINDDGFAVGKKSRYGLSGSSAIMTTPEFNSVAFLPIPNGGYASAINNHNLIVGTTGSNASAGEYSYGFIYNGVTLTNLGTLPSNGPGSAPGLTSSAADINDANQVVGNSWLVTALTSLYEPEKYHGFLWENGHMTDLNDLIVGLPNANNWILTRANAINENGDIVGVGLLNGIEHGFLLASEQVPPPPENLPPVAVAGADQTSGKAPLTVNFTGTGSSDPEGSALAYAWDFGDGSSSSEPSSTHDFTQAGTYVVQLTVTDDQGLADTAQLEIVAKGRKR